MTERYMIDDAGSLIDMETRDSYDYMSEIVDILNSKEDIICALNRRLSEYLPMWVFEKVINRRIEATENEEIKKELKELLSELK